MRPSLCPLEKLHRWQLRYLALQLEATRNDSTPAASVMLQYPMFVTSQEERPQSTLRPRYFTQEFLGFLLNALVLRHAPNESALHCVRSRSACKYSHEHKFKPPKLVQIQAPQETRSSTSK